MERRSRRSAATRQFLDGKIGNGCPDSGAAQSISGCWQLVAKRLVRNRGGPYAFSPPFDAEIERGMERLRKSFNPRRNTRPEKKQKEKV